MTRYAQRALQVETEFLAGVEANLQQAKGRQLRGTIWQTARHDEETALRAMLARRHKIDRSLLKQLPTNRRVALHGYERRWWFGKRRTGVAIASVLTPLEFLADGAEGSPPPIGLGELMDHVRRLAGDADLPQVIGVCSPSGFTDEVRGGQIELPNVTLVLVEPREGGGWRVTGKGDKLAESVLALFDPEDTNQKLARVRQEIKSRSADLLVGGVDAASVAGRLSVPEPLVSQAMAQAAREDPELRMTESDGRALLYRGAVVHTPEKRSMNVVDRIRALFARQGDEAEKINLLAERRAALTQRRDRIYEDIGALEDKEAKLLDQGRSATSSVVKRRLASQLAQLRKDISRQNTTANMLNSQVNILSTNIHNLTLIQQGQMAKLPDTEELTETAVKAEEMLESLKADADLVSGLEIGLGEVMTSDEELEILKEFEMAEPEPEVKAPARASRRAAAAAPEASAAEPAAGTPEPPDEDRRQKADPEAI